MHIKKDIIEEQSPQIILFSTIIHPEWQWIPFLCTKPNHSHCSTTNNGALRIEVLIVGEPFSSHKQQWEKSSAKSD